MHLTIRPFEATDLPALQALRHAAFAPVFQSFREIVGEAIARVAFEKADEEQAALLASLCEPGPAHQVFVAELDGNIVGFVSFSLDTRNRIGEIGLNAVNPGDAGKGIGTRMYAFALARMKEAGMAVAAVGTGGDPSHAAARRAYEKAGFGPAVPSLYLYKLL